MQNYLYIIKKDVVNKASRVNSFKNDSIYSCTKVHDLGGNINIAIAEDHTIVYCAKD